jgi:hypothetical protein
MRCPDCGKCFIHNNGKRYSSGYIRCLVSGSEICMDLTVSVHGSKICYDYESYDTVSMSLVVGCYLPDSG